MNDFFQALLASESTKASLQNIAAIPIPDNYDQQNDFIYRIESELTSKAVQGFDVEVEAIYRSQLFPALSRRLTASNTVQWMKLYCILYEKIRAETLSDSTMLISWLQPPQSLVDVLSLGWGDENVLSRYKSMLDQIQHPASEENMGDVMKNYGDQWPRKQAFVVGLMCDLNEFCEFVWRYARNDWSGEHC